MADGKYLIGESLREKLKSTIAKVDSIPLGGPVSRIPTAFDEGTPYVPKVFRVCTVAGSWPVDTSKNVTYYGVTSTPNTVSVINKLISLPAPGRAATRLVNVARDGTQWYLVSFQMATVTGIMATATQTITFFGTAATQTITYVTEGAETSVITGITASLNTSDCSIAIEQTTTAVKTVGSTQTATVVSMSATEVATITTGTYTATFVSLEI